MKDTTVVNKEWLTELAKEKVVQRRRKINLQPSAVNERSLDARVQEAISWGVSSNETTGFTQHQFVRLLSDLYKEYKYLERLIRLERLTSTHTSGKMGTLR